MRVFRAVTLATLLLPAIAEAGNPWEELMGPGKPRLWTDPDARFYLDLPVGWEAHPVENAPVVHFSKRSQDHGVQARVSVEMRNVPPGIDGRHFSVSVLSDVKASVIGFRMIDEDKMKMAGARAYRSYFTYRERGNVELANEAVVTTVIVGERAFVITFECAAGTRGVFWEDLEKMLKSFVGRAPGDEGLALPKTKKRVKAGEMINPEAIKY